MKYIVHRRFKRKAICGHVNLPSFTECESIGGFITHEGKIICFETSENAHQYFAQNADGMGMIRGNLTQAIQKKLANRGKEDYQKKWNLVWDDEVCQKYRRSDYEDYWLWNHDFFNAPIHDLMHIATLIGIKEVV